ncbi:MAG: redoxin family protein [Gemmataceae bacterium]
MRLLAIAFTLTIVGIGAAQEKELLKKNPFRDGTGKGLAEPNTTPSTPKPDPIKNPPRVLRAAEAGIGKLIPDVSFTDTAGKSGKLSDFKASKFTVVAFTNTTCPLCKKYAPVLARIEKEYAAKGVGFLFVNPTATDKPDTSAFAGRYVHDTDGKLTAAFAATSTTEAIVLDAARTVVYRGAIDDQYGLGYSFDAARNKFLTVALDDALAGKQPVIVATTAPGCALEPDTAKAPAVALTYHARIERIIQANCVECHRAGGVGPFSLEKYEDVVAHKGVIKKVTDNGTMPPWFAVHAKSEHSPFANDRSLTATDKKDLLAFLSGDMKKGDPADSPLPRRFESGWLIGKPDAIFQIPKAVAIKAEGTMAYQNLRVETDFEEDRWVQAIEVQPTAREVTHHVLVFAVAKGARLGGEAAGFFAVYVPGNNSLIYPDGYAKKLPKGATLHFQMHYTPNGKATTDQTKIGMIFAKQAPRYEVHVAGIANHRFEIPAGDDNYRVDAKIPVPFDAKVLALFPHAHLRGKAAKYELKTPDGKTTTILDVPRYDFNWQLQYRFADPVNAPRGSSLTYTAWYDNSDKNPANPNPKKPVRWGQQTYEEMHLGYVEFVIDRK